MNRSARTPNFLPWAVWGVAQLFYVIAILNRNSLSALGLVAQDHFNIPATILSSFAVLQLVMYAGMQIPVGILLDRFGVSIVLLSGGTVMLIGQVVMAYTSEVWLAVAARMFLGAGDAGVFISVMRILPDWFPARRLPLLGQITGQMGSIGQVISILPLAFVVDRFGWSAGFMGIAAVVGIVILLGFVVIRDYPGSGTVLEKILHKKGSLSTRAELLLKDGNLGLQAMPSTTKAMGNVMLEEDASVFQKLAFLIKIPGIRLAFWVHFTPPFTATVLLLLWGTPLLVGGAGVDPVTSQVLLTSTVLAAIISALSLGKLTARFATKRVHIVLVLTAIIISFWIPILLWPTTPPFWLLAATFMVTIMGGPGSLVAFEVVRSYSPRRIAGIATGLVNMGGFIAALIALFLIGLILDLQGAGTPETYTMQAFQWAFASMGFIWALGIWRILAELKNTRKWVEQRGGS